MTPKQIECYLALIDKKSYSEVAEMLQLPQSVLLKNMKSLEKELAVELFVKSNSQLHPTDAGRMLYAHMYYILSQYRELERVANTHRAYVGTTLDVGSMYFAEFFDLISLLHDFQLAHPQITARLHEFRANETLNLLNTQRLSCAFMYKEFFQRSYSRMLDIAEDPVVVIMNKRLAGQYRQPLDLADLKNRRFILLQGDVMLHRYFQNICIDAGFVPNELLVNARVSTVLELVQSSDAVSLLTSSFTSNIPADSNIEILQLARPHTLTLSLICANAVASEEYLQFESFVADYLDLSSRAAGNASPAAL